MKLLEYEAKSLFKAEGLPIPKSFISGKSPEFLPVVLKSQVPTGGRGKAGGIIVVHTQDEYDLAMENLLQLEIKGFLPKTILAEELLDIESELYLSIVIDRPTANIVLMAYTHGGIEVEGNTAGNFLRIPIDNKNSESVGQQLADYYDIADKTFVLQDMIEKLYTLFVSQDMTLLEINPLIVTESGNIVAGDAKIALDDAAAFRHPDWSFEQKRVETNFITLDPNGTVATIANGAGLAMATVDAVADAGLVPANFLDIGGGANEAGVLAAFRRIMEYPNISVIIVNIFAGITRCDEVARAIIAANSQITDLPPIAIRLAGTNYDEAVKLLADQNIIMQPSLEAAITSVKEYV